MRFCKITVLIFIVLSICCFGCAKKQIITQPDSMATEQLPEEIVDISDEPGLEDAAQEVEDIPEPSIRDKKIESVPELKAVHFDYDKATLSDHAREILKQNAAWVIKNFEYQIIIEGHTDERGTIEYNLALGQERATAVRTYLVYLGVQAKRIATISYGEEKPMDIQGSEESWSKNRRAEMRWVKQG